MSNYSATVARDELDRLKDIYEYKHGRQLTSKDIADELNISPAAFCKRLKGDVLFRTDEIVSMAKFFGITCDELLTGVSAENNLINQEYGLNDKALNWLKRNTKANQEYITLLNIILSDENIADSLFRSILIYCNSVMLKLMPLSSTDLNEYIYINSNTSDGIIKRLASDKIIQVLELISSEWDAVLKNKISMGIANSKSKTNLSIQRRHKLLSIKKCRTEKDKRYYLKHRQRVTNIDIIEQIRITDESINKYKVLKGILEDEFSSIEV